MSDEKAPSSTGGRVQAAETYLVGEHGPELFVLPQGRRVPLLTTDPGRETMQITAKVTCSAKQESGNQTSLSFVPDYADGRNKEWSLYTPSLSLSMTVKNEVAANFEQGKPYTLTFEPTED